MKNKKLSLLIIIIPILILSCSVRPSGSIERCKALGYDQAFYANIVGGDRSYFCEKQINFTNVAISGIFDESGSLRCGCS